jgi:excisionase family DNA binding protein
MLINLTKRVMISGKRQFLPISVDENGQIKSAKVLVNGEEQRHHGGVYYLDWSERGKRKRISVGTNLGQALMSRLRKQEEMTAMIRKKLAPSELVGRGTEIEKPFLSIKERLAKCQTALTAEDLSKLLAISEPTVYKMVKNGSMPHYRIATLIRFDPKQISEWLGVAIAHGQKYG